MANSHPKGGSHGSQTTGRNRPNVGEVLYAQARHYALAGQNARSRECRQSHRGICRGAKAVRQAPCAGTLRGVLRHQVVGKPG